MPGDARATLCVLAEVAEIDRQRAPLPHKFPARALRAAVPAFARGCPRAAALLFRSPRFGLVSSAAGAGQPELHARATAAGVGGR